MPDLSDLTIRRATTQDAQHIAQHRYPDPDSDFADLQAYASWVKVQLESGRYLGLLAECKGETVAGAGLLILNWGPTRGQPSPWRGRVVNVFTAPQWRKKGIATHLMEHLLQGAKEMGINAFSLACTADSEHMYQRLGFQRYEAEMLHRSFE